MPLLPSITLLGKVMALTWGLGDEGKRLRRELLGAGRGSRTPKTRRSADFESAASASSAIPAEVASDGD